MVASAQPAGEAVFTSRGVTTAPPTHSGLVLSAAGAWLGRVQLRLDVFVLGWMGPMSQAACDTNCSGACEPTPTAVLHGSIVPTECFSDAHITHLLVSCFDCAATLKHPARHAPVLHLCRCLSLCTTSPALIDTLCRKPKPWMLYHWSCPEPLPQLAWCQAARPLSYVLGSRWLAGPLLGSVKEIS